MNQISFEHDEKYLYQRIYGILFCIDEMISAKHPAVLFKRIDTFTEDLDILGKHSKSDKYQEQVKKGIESYYTNNSDFEINLSVIHLSCITNPVEFDLEKFYVFCFENCFTNFYKYWEEILANYKRKGAKIDRFDYLIDLCKDFLKIARDYNLKCRTTQIFDTIKSYEGRLALLKK